MISGCVPVVAADLVRWAEEVAARLDESMGPTLFERGEYVEIVCRDPGAPPRVERTQHLADGFLRQRLELDGLGALDQEDVLEGVVWLLLNRRVVARQPDRGAGSEPARVPDWLAVGVAQGLYPELRERNLGVGLDRWARGTMTPPERLTARAVMPAGRWAEKADAALWVAWLQGRADAAMRFADAWQRIAEGKAVGASWWWDSRAGGADTRDGEREWELWLAGQRDALRGWSSRPDDQLGSMRDWRTVSAVDLASVHAPASVTALSLDQLVAHRGEKWARLLAARMALRIRLAAVGQSPDVQQVASRYAAYLDAVAGKGRALGFLRGRSPARHLQALWREAEAARERLERDYRARAEYLEQVSTRMFDAGLQDGNSAEDPAVRQYLDLLEQRVPEGAPR